MRQVGPGTRLGILGWLIYIECMSKSREYSVWRAESTRPVGAVFASISVDGSHRVPRESDEE